MTAYSPLRIASSEFGKWSVILVPVSKTLPIESDLGIPIYVNKKITLGSKQIGHLCMGKRDGHRVREVVKVLTI